MCLFFSYKLIKNIYRLRCSGKLREVDCGEFKVFVYAKGYFYVTVL